MALLALLGALSFAAGACKSTAVAPGDWSLNIPDQGVGALDAIPHHFKVVDLGDAATMGAGGEQANLFSVWGETAQAIFAVGSKGTVVFFDGQGWQAQTTPTKQDLTSVWGTSAKDVWAVGFSGTVLHYDGQSWQDQSPPVALFSTDDGGPPKGDAAVAARVNLWGVWATGKPTTQVLYAVGDRGLILRRTGAQWSRVPSGVEDNLGGVWGASADQVFIVGGFGTILTGSTSFSKASTGVSKTLWRVWGRSGSDVYVVGLSGTVLHFNGSNWTKVDGAPKQFLRGIWGPANNAGVTYIVGWDGTLLRMSGGPSFASGATFAPFTGITPNRLEGIWGTLVPGTPPDGGFGDGGVGDGGGAVLVPALWVTGTSGTIISGP
jgi:hypothetical protein